MLKGFLERLLGGEPAWDGSERRVSLRAKCDFQLELTLPKAVYAAKVLDVGARGVRARIQAPLTRVARRGLTVQARAFNLKFPCELDTIRGKIRWVKPEQEDAFVVAIAFDDELEALQRSWVKAVLLKNLIDATQKRTQTRVKALVRTWIQVENHQFEGSLRDISTRGARLETVKTYPVGTELTLRIGPARPGSSPELGLHGMTLKAIVRRVGPSPASHQMGLLFQLEDGQRAALLKWVRGAAAQQKALLPS